MVYRVPILRSSISVSHHKTIPRCCVHWLGGGRSVGNECREITIKFVALPTLGVSLALAVGLLLVGCAESPESRINALVSVDTAEASEEVQARLADYQRRVKEDPLNGEHIGNLGITYEIHGYSEEALEAYELATELQPDEMRWPYYHAILLAARFDLDIALEKIDIALARDSDYAPAWLQKGEYLLDNSEFEKALETFVHAQSLTADPYAHLGQALALLELNRPEDALASLNQMASLANHENVQRLRGTALLRMGRREEGSKLLEGLGSATSIRWDDPVAQAKQEHSVDHFGTRLMKVVRLVRAQAYESALQILADLRVESPTNKHVMHLLGTVYEGRGDKQQALNVYVEGMSHHPGFYVFRTAAASIFKEFGDVSAAIKHLDAAIEIDPKLHWAYSQKAQILMEQKQWLSASHLLDQAIGLKDDDPDLYTYLGICLGFMDRWPEAANLYRVAISIDVAHVPSYINLARAETILQNEDEAVKALTAAQNYGASQAMIASVERQRDQIKRMQINTVRQ
ncbi:MAG: tetratricopeptide repeat protein [Gammaproteobacteria bacterium]|nr:tetratricopeptide repeat protein [Gammaproteobacteria bacterium]